MKKLKKLHLLSIAEMPKSMTLLSTKEQLEAVGGGDGSYTSPFTISEYNKMSADHTWRGGCVVGLGYVSFDVFCYNAYDQNTYSLSGYLSQDEGLGWYIVGIVNPLVGLEAGRLSDFEKAITADLINLGYGSGNKTYITVTRDPSYTNSPNDLFTSTVYDAYSGQKLLTKTFTLVGAFH